MSLVRIKSFDMTIILAHDRYLGCKDDLLVKCAQFSLAYIFENFQNFFLLLYVFPFLFKCFCRHVFCKPSRDCIHLY